MATRTHAKRFFSYRIVSSFDLVLMYVVVRNQLRFESPLCQRRVKVGGLVRDSVVDDLE